MVFGGVIVIVGVGSEVFLPLDSATLSEVGRTFGNAIGDE